MCIMPNCRSFFILGFRQAVQFRQKLILQVTVIPSNEVITESTVILLVVVYATLYNIMYP